MGSLRAVRALLAAVLATTGLLASGAFAGAEGLEWGGRPHIPLPAADNLEDIVLPTPERIAETVRRSLGS